MSAQVLDSESTPTVDPFLLSIPFLCFVFVFFYQKNNMKKITFETYTYTVKKILTKYNYNITTPTNQNNNNNNNKTTTTTS